MDPITDDLSLHKNMFFVEMESEECISTAF